MSTKVTRLDFVKTLGAVTGGVLIGSNVVAAGPYVLKNKAKRGAQGKVNMALIGIGHQGGVDAREFINSGLANIVAVCDVDLDSESAQGTISLVPKARQFRDWRVMFDTMANDFDAVQVVIPDFAHFPAAMAAMQLGKHVFVEKPMAHRFLEAELMARMADQNPRIVTQVGNQGHSGENYFQFKAWKEAGIIKDVTAVSAFMNGGRRWHPYDPNITKFPEAQPLPEGMTEKDWDAWLSQAESHEFNEKYHPGNWRGWWDFGMGALGDWGAHTMDTVHEFLELGLPFEIDPVHVVNRNDYFFPLEETLLFRFPSRGDMPPLDLTWYDGADNPPPVPDGYFTVDDEQQRDRSFPTPGGAAPQGRGDQTGGTGFAPSAQQEPSEPRLPRAGKIIYSKELMFKGGSHASPLYIFPDVKAKEMEPKLPEVPESPSNHYENFLLSCMGEEKTRSSFQVFAPMSQMFSLGVIAARLGKKLLFNRDTKEITNDTFANAMLTGVPPRKGWESYYNMV